MSHVTGGLSGAAMPEQPLSLPRLRRSELWSLFLFFQATARDAQSFLARTDIVSVREREFDSGQGALGDAALRRPTWRHGSKRSKRAARQQAPQATTRTVVYCFRTINGTSTCVCVYENNQNSGLLLSYVCVCVMYNTMYIIRLRTS